MERIYFKQHVESCNIEWTIYGSYDTDKMEKEGDVNVIVHDITKDNEKDHLEHSVYRTYIFPKNVTKITKEELETALAKLISAEDMRYKADEILKSLL